VPPTRPLWGAALCLAGLLCALQACSTGSANVAVRGVPVTVADTPRPLSDNDRRFLVEASGSGLYQVEAARLAQQRTADPTLKAYAAMVIRQQGTANEELRALAQLHGFIWPGGPPATRQAELATLRSLSGDAFDQRFIQQVGIADRQADVLLFEAANRSLDDRALRAWSERMVPMLQNHLAMALQLPVRAKA